MASKGPDDAHAQDDLNLRILCMCEGIFSLDAVHIKLENEKLYILIFILCYYN